jgi:hypothetical protein
MACPGVWPLTRLGVAPINEAHSIPLDLPVEPCRWRAREDSQAWNVAARFGLGRLHGTILLHS